MTLKQTTVRDEIQVALAQVTDPELNANIVELKMLKEVSVDANLNVEVLVALTTAKCPLRNKLRDDILKAIEGTQSYRLIKHVEVKTAEMSAQDKSELMDRARQLAQNNNTVNIAALSNTRILAISSGKGGVGKSTISANLALALAYLGNNVGILDADIWGFSIPKLLGITGNLKVENRQILPLRYEVGKGNLNVISMGFLTDENSAIMWRGLILNRAVQHFLEDVKWEKLNYLIIDMPPGTGDIQMGIARMLPKTEVITVTTPSEMVEKIASRAAQMAIKSNIKSVGVIENMSYFRCDHGDKYYLFGKDGGKRLAKTLNVPLLIQIPLSNDFSDNAKLNSWGENQNNNAEHKQFIKLANRVQKEFPYGEIEGCTARLMSIFDNLDRQLEINTK